MCNNLHSSNRTGDQVIYDEDYDYEAAELRAEDAWQRRQSARLAAHPDCRDPDHPGCVHCRDEDEDEGDDE